MSRQLDKKFEERQRRDRELALLSVAGGLEDAVERAGGELRGFSVGLRGYDVLMTLRAEFPAGPQVAFVGAGDLVGCFIKAMREGNADALSWRVDNFKVK